MATKYEEICTAGRQWIDRINRARGYLFALHKLFITYCQIPPDRIHYLKWVGPEGREHRYSGEDENGRGYDFVEAAIFDEEMDLWRLGMRISLQSGSSVFYALRVFERDGQAAVEIREGDPPMVVNVQDASECIKIFDTIINLMKRAFREGEGSRIGFELGKAAETTTETKNGPEGANQPGL